MPGSELALPEHITDAAREARKNARAESTRRAYAHWVGEFLAWCEAMGRQPFPAATETVAGYLIWLSKGRDGKSKPLAASSIAQAMAAIKLAQRAKGHTFDSDNIVLKETLKGIRREIARTRSIRMVSPLSSKQVGQILELYREDDPKEARDRACIALGFAAARRRSELVGLDWQQLGSGTGVLTADESGLTITLMVSKTRQEGGEPEQYVVPRQDAPRVCSAVEHWIRLRGIGPGQPVFPAAFTGGGLSSALYVGVSWVTATKTWRAQIRLPGDVKRYRKLGRLFATQEEAVAAIVAAGGRKELRQAAVRMSGATVPAIIRRALTMYFAKTSDGRKLKAKEKRALVAMYSGHSMRSGHVTDAFERGMPLHQIMAQTGHQTERMVMRYGRVVNRHKENSLRGSGL